MTEPCVKNKLCSHTLSEQVTACADNVCPICLANELNKLKKRYDDLLEMWMPASKTISRLNIELAEKQEDLQAVLNALPTLMEWFNKHEPRTTGGPTSPYPTDIDAERASLFKKRELVNKFTVK